jgi:threonine synthase
VAAGAIAPQSRIVAFLTGHALKDTDAIMRSVGKQGS